MEKIKFILLHTSGSNEEIWLNPDHIESLDQTFGQDSTHIRTSNGFEHSVREAPEEICRVTMG